MTTETIIIDAHDPDAIDPIPRNRYGAPRAPHPHTGKATTWQRPSGLAKKFLADKYHLDLWVQRTIAKGAGLAPDLGHLAAHLDLTDDKAQLDDLAAQMGRAGGRDAKANVGTAIHAVMERILNGATPDYAPDLRPTVDAITDIIAHYDIQAAFVEPFIITPDIVTAAGSADGLVTTNVTDPTTLTVFDLKTGQRDPREFTTLTEWAVQLAIYAHATHRWEGTGHPLIELPAINTDVALVLWAPSGGVHAELIGIDIAAGWELAKLCMAVKSSRSRGTAAAMEIDLPKYRPHAPAAGGDIPEHVQLMKTLATLRVRLRTITTKGDVTKAEVVDHWPPGVPVLLGTEHDHLQDQWTVAAISGYADRLEARFGVAAADPAEVYAVAVAIGDLPADLGAAALADIDAEGIDTMAPYVCDLDTIAGILDRAAATVAAREAVVDRLGAANPAAAYGALDVLQERVGLPTGPDGRALVRPLTAHGMDIYEALVSFYADRPDGSTVEERVTDLVAVCGGRSRVVQAAKGVADTYGMDRVRSTEAVAADPVLAALVIHLGHNP